MLFGLNRERKRLDFDHILTSVAPKRGRIKKSHSARPRFACKFLSDQLPYVFPQLDSHLNTFQITFCHRPNPETRDIYICGVTNFGPTPPLTPARWYASAARIQDPPLICPHPRCRCDPRHSSPFSCPWIRSSLPKVTRTERGSLQIRARR